MMRASARKIQQTQKVNRQCGVPEQERLWIQMQREREPIIRHAS